MLIECDSCRTKACGDCVMTALLQAGDAPAIELDETELEALDVLAELGMIPPLRHDLTA